MFFCFLMFFVLFNVVLLLLKHKRTKLCGLWPCYRVSHTTSWTERVFCSSIIDFIWFVLTLHLT